VRQLLLAFILVAAPAGAQELIGFHPDRVEAQREMEQRADDWIVADELLEWDEAQEQIDIAAAVLTVYAEQLEQVAGLRDP